MISISHPFNFFLVYFDKSSGNVLVQYWKSQIAMSNGDNLEAWLQSKEKYLSTPLSTRLQKYESLELVDDVEFSDVVQFTTFFKV